MIKQRLNRLEQGSSTVPLVIIRTKYNGGRITGYRLSNGEQLNLHPSENNEAFRARARATGNAQSNGFSIIKAIHENNSCQL